MKEPKPTPPMPISLGGGEKLRVSESAVYYNVATGRVMHVPIKTNYDRIVNESPELLAMEICTDFGGIPWCKNISECQDALCVECVIKWLKQEAEK